MTRMDKDKLNYHTGSKNELITLIHTTGIIPYKSLRHLAPPTKYQRAVRAMVEDGTVKVESVDIEKRRKEKIVSLRIESRQIEKYEDFVDQRLKDYYKTYGTRNYWKTTCGNTADIAKAIKDADAQIYLYACGYKIGPDKKDMTMDFLGKNESSFYISREIKKIDGYSDGKNSKRITASRATGVLLTGGGNYILYNLGNRIIEWKRFSEVKFSTYVNELVRNKSEIEYEAKMKKEAIILSTNNNVLNQICSLNYSQNKSYKVTLMNIDYVYDYVYSVPEDDNGKVLLKIMGIPAWKYKIKNRYLKHDDIENQKFTSIPCDGYDKEKDVYILMFCIPDLVKLKSFCARANLEGNKNKYKILCYNHQIPLVVSLVGKNATIMSIDVKQLYNKCFGEKEINSG